MPARHSGVWGTEAPTAEHRRSYADASTTPFWLDSPQRPAPLPQLEGESETELAIVGGGLSGLWAALLAKQRDRTREVVLLEGRTIGHAASGRNGGFFVYSLTHGLANGLARFPAEMDALERHGIDNFEQAISTIEALNIDCDLVRGGDLSVALEPHQVEWLAEAADEGRRFGHRVELLDAAAVRGEVHSPLFLGGLWQRNGAATVNPAKLCWGLRAAALDLGVRIHEQAGVKRLRRRGDGIILELGDGALQARQALLATSADRGLLAQMRRRVIPVYDYVLVTEPLNRSQLDSVGWQNRQGVGDSANQFHYYRLTADKRILWGGYDAIYHYGSRVADAADQRERSFAGLAKRFFMTFPQLEGIRFSHRWGGAIDTCSRFFAFHGTGLGGRVAYTVGHTGLGVCSSRFGAGVALDLLAGTPSEPSTLSATQSCPLPFPPEPLRWASVQLTRNRLAAADRKSGRRGLWLRTLDRLGLGFDS